jgi:hypothetical protein
MSYLTKIPFTILTKKVVFVSNLTKYSIWLSVIDHFDQGCQFFIQFD